MTSMRMSAHFLSAVVALAKPSRPRDEGTIGRLTRSRPGSGRLGRFGWRAVAWGGLSLATLTGNHLAARAGSLQFDGNADYAYIYVNVSETAATHELWFKTTSPNGGLLSVTDSGSAHDRHLYLLNGDIYARLWTD